MQLKRPSSVAVAIGFAICMLIALEAGFQIGDRERTQVSAQQRQRAEAVESTMLSIVALVLAFTLNSTLQRFSTRVEAVVDEANAIGTAYLRSQHCHEMIRPMVQNELGEYLKLRIQMAEIPVSKVSSELIQRTEAKQAAIWKLTMEAAQRESSPIMALFVSSVNEMIDAYGRRKTAIIRHIPFSLIAILLSTFLLTVGVVGYSNGLSDCRPSLVCYFMLLQIGTLVFLINDLDRPRSGFIRVPHNSLTDLSPMIENSKDD